jgi:hypothetical protein
MDKDVKKFIEEIQELRAKGGSGKEYGLLTKLGEACEIILSLYEKNRWIPITEKLPNKVNDFCDESSEWVWITDGKEIIESYYNFRTNNWFCHGMNKEKITHWQYKFLPKNDQ